MTLTPKMRSVHSDASPTPSWRLLFGADRHVSRILSAVLLATLLAACGGAGESSRVALDEADRIAVQDWLLPRFELAVAPRLALAAPAAAELDGIREQIAVLAEEGLEYDLWVVDDPDIDAGCLPGGVLWLTEGLLSVARDRSEVLTATVFASSKCADSSRMWRGRADQALVDDRDHDPIYLRYRDYRLRSNAPLYNLMVSSGCDRDCASALDGRILAVEGDSGAWRRLLARTVELAPDSALAWRIGSMRVPSTDDSMASDAAEDWLEPFHRRREALLDLAESRRHLWARDLLPAYRAGLRARNVLPDSVRLQMHQAELDLANRHPEYGQRILTALERQGKSIPHAGYWWGWVHLNLRRRPEAAASLEQSIEKLPRMTAHYRLGDALLRMHRPEEARAQYEIALEAGTLHPYYIRAQARLEDLDEA